MQSLFEPPRGGSGGGGKFRGEHPSDFSSRRTKKNWNAFFPGACTSGKTLLGPQVCERSECARRAAKLSRFTKMPLWHFYETTQRSSITRRAAKTPLAEAWDRECVTPEQSPMT